MTVQTAVQNGSSLAVKDAVGRLRDRHFPDGHWVGVSNRYALDTIARVRQDSRGGTSLVSSQLSEYVAASVVLHCFDGWSYLAHAVESLLDGDPETSVHLAYYAELRAAISFLASEGIGVFSSTHCWIGSNGVCHLFRGPGTHEFVWQAIREWAGAPSNSVRLLNLFRVRGRRFSEWLQAAGYSTGSGPSARLAARWLKDWSLDLLVLEDDRDFRNEVSYRPQRMRIHSSHMPIKEALKTIIEFWRVCEPSASERFSLLDRYLLRHALETTYRMGTGIRYLGSPFVRFVENAMTNLGISTSGLLREFLLGRRERANHPILKEAKKKGQDSRRRLRPVSIIARAILLLRLASAATEDLLSSQAIDLSDFDFWWSDLGEGIGLWGRGARPMQMADLWAEVQPMLDDIERWCNGHPPSTTMIEARRDLAYELWQLTQFQRAGLWAMVP